MEVTVSHAASGRSCVVGVAEADTVMGLKKRALEEMFAGSDIDAGRDAVELAARIGTGEAGEEIYDDHRISDTRLEGGDCVQLVRRWVTVAAPASYVPGEGDVSAFALSPSNAQCCVGTIRGNIAVYDTRTSELVCLVEGEDPIESAAFSRCGEWVTVSKIRDITVLRTSTYESVCRLHGHTLDVTCLVWTHCGCLVSGSFDKTVRVWDLHEGVCAAVLEGHTEVVYGLDVTRTSIFSGSRDRMIREWDIGTLTYVGTLSGGHTSYVHDLAVIAGGQQMVSCSNDGLLKIWCTETRQCLHSYALYDFLYYLAVPEEGDFVALLSQSDLILTRLSTGDELCKVPRMDDCLGVRVTRCGRWLFTLSSNNVNVYAVSDLLKQYAS